VNDIDKEDHSDGEAFEVVEVDEIVALESKTIKHMIEDDCTDNGIPLPNITSMLRPTTPMKSLQAWVDLFLLYHLG